MLSVEFCCYLSGDAVLYKPSFFDIVRCLLSPPLGEGWEGVISSRPYECRNTRGVG